MERTTAVVFCLALPLAASCYSFNAANTVKGRMSIDTHCPDDQITVVDIGGNRYRANGCGQRATFACEPQSAGSEQWDCRPEEEQDPGTVFGTTEGGEQQVRDSAHMDAGVAPGQDAGRPGPDAGAAPPSAADAGPPPADPASTVRAAIDAHAVDILGCTGRTSIGVHASWDAHGVVTFGLPGDLAGRPEEGCVRTAIGPVTTSGPAGELMELVRH